MKVVWELPLELAKWFTEMAQEAYSWLVAGNFKEAERIYEKQCEIFRTEENRLPIDEKYHKGGSLYNWGWSLLLQNNLLSGFRKISLAYIEDLLKNDLVIFKIYYLDAPFKDNRKLISP